ncbi:MAG: ATP-dependent DNA helicase [Planctomycetes bacterium]|nr:ATP-dependent DNA helicase [Planctomycetota bacterium]
MTDPVRTLLGPEGRIAARLQDYEVRPQQLAMAEAVADAIASGHHLLVEAGTGVGKSFAYLLPAVLHAAEHQGEGPVVIATRTIALQEQLETKDLPFLKAVLPIEWSSVTAVGRNHYVCLRRMHLAFRERGALFAEPEQERELQRVVDWSLATRDGLRFELDPPVPDPVWEEVQAEHGNCLYKACPHFEPCPYQRSRRRMERAQVLVVNHALYMADVALRMAGAAYLPAHRVVIFDEAHHLERIATESLGLRFGQGTLAWHLRRLQPRQGRRSLLREHGSPESWLLLERVRHAGEGFFAALAQRLSASGGETVALRDQVLDNPLGPLLGQLGVQVGNDAVAVQAVDLRTELQARANGLLALAAVVDSLCAPGEGQQVRWLEAGRRGPELHCAPLDVSAALREHVFQAPRTAILTSATLGPGGDPGFQWLRGRLGIDQAATLRLGSPFDYASAVKVVLEEALPDPGRDPAGFAAEAVRRIEAHVLRNHGRALVLCTSWAFVRAAAEQLRPALQRAGITLLVQGEAPLQRLLGEKMRDPHSVLLGTESLWEGIDLPGEALTLLILARLPFAQPAHPLVAARVAAIEARGGDGFQDHSLPEAVLKFRQGFGRLIRTARDRGTFVVLDPRVRTRPYGRHFLAGLPEGLRADPAE